MKELFTLDLKLTTLVDCTVMKQSGYIVVSGQRGSKDLWTIILFSLQKGAGGWSLKQEKQQWESPCKHPVCLLGLQILWREYLAISCSTCEDIKLMDLNSTLEETVVFSGRKVSRMCKGWHKLYVLVDQTTQVLELDCSTTSFTLLRSIELGDKKDDPTGFCYIPYPIKLIVVCGSNSYMNGIKGMHHESGETIWFNDGVDDRRITRSALLHLPNHRALLVADRINKRVFLLDPGTGSHLQTISLRDLGEIFDLMLHNGLVLIRHVDGSGGHKLSCFSLDSWQQF